MLPLLNRRKWSSVDGKLQLFLPFFESGWDLLLFLLIHRFMVVSRWASVLLFCEWTDLLLLWFEIDQWCLNIGFGLSIIGILSCFWVVVNLNCSSCSSDVHNFLLILWGLLRNSGKRKGECVSDVIATFSLSDYSLSTVS